MDIQALFQKLDKMNENISVLRENSARMGVILEENTRNIKAHMKGAKEVEQRLSERLSVVEKTQSQWKGAVVVVSTLFGAIVMFLKSYIK